MPKKNFGKLDTHTPATGKLGSVGKNGAGKSTMLKIIAGLQKPSSGNVAVPQGVTVVKSL